MRILRPQHDLATLSSKALAQRLTVHRSNHDVAWLRRYRAVDQDKVAWINSRPDHGIAFNAHQVDVRRSHVQKLVEGETFFQVIRCRRWEACWHLKGVQREVSSAWIEGSEDGDHDEKRLYCIFVQLSALPALVNRVDSRYDNRLATHTPGHFLAHLKGLCDTK